MSKSSDTLIVSVSLIVLRLSFPCIISQSPPALAGGHTAHTQYYPPRNNNSSSTGLIIKTCDQVPTLCVRKGSPGHQCCNRQCVNLQTSKFHCGKCGTTCRFSEICCGGKCVNLFSHDEHCGGCGNRCSYGDSCVYGMCAYAN